MATILLVDDETNLTSGLKRALYREKYDIITANSADEALLLLEQKLVDVIVSDENMPGMTGSGLLSLVRHKYPFIIRIMLTGHINSEAAFRAINEGDVYRFLVKPCNALDLAVTIRRALQYKTLIGKIQNVLSQFEKQTTLLGLLENKQPGMITSQLIRNFEISPDEMDYLKLIQLMDLQLEKSMQLLGGKSPEGTSALVSHNSVFVSEDRAPDITSLNEKVSYIPVAYGEQQPIQNAEAPEISKPSDDNPASSNTLSDLKPIMTRTEMKSLLDGCGELKGLSPTVSQVIKMSRQPNCSIDQIAKVIKQDHAISLKILKLANSTAYSRGEPVNSVHKAVLRIGINQIQQAVFNIGVIDKFSGDSKADLIRIPQFWEHSISTGLIASEIASLMGERDLSCDVAFTMGLLHDIGKLIYLDMLGDSYRQILEMADRLQIPLEQVESRMLLINHADAMDRILHIWKFPNELINPVALHSLSLGNIRRIAPRTMVEVATLSLANRLSHALLLGMSGNPVLYPTDDYFPSLGLQPDCIAALEKNIPAQTDEIKIALLASSNMNNWSQYRNEIREQVKTPFYPIYMSLNPLTDSLRIFFDRIRNLEGLEKPNIGIIHIKSPQERVILTTRYKEAEQNAHVQNIPLIIFSTQGNLILDNAFMGNRPYRTLPFPIFIPRIISAINSLLSAS